MLSSQGKKIGIAILLIVFTLAMAACDMNSIDFADNDDPLSYTLTVEMEGEGEILDDDGEVILDPAEDAAEIAEEEDGEIILTAEPADGWYFSEWMGDVAREDEEEETIIVKMDEDKEVTAVFLLPETSIITEFQLDSKERVYSLEFSPDGSKLIAAGDESIKVRDPLTGEVIREFTEHDDRVRRVTFSSDGSKIASFAGDLGGGTTKIWETDTGNVKEEFQHDDVVNSLAFSPDDSWIAFGVRNQPLEVYNLETEETTTFGGEDASIASVAFTSDSERVIAQIYYDYHNTPTRIWDIESEELITEFTGQDGELRALDISSDDGLIAASSPVIVWEVEDGEIDEDNIITEFQEQDGIVDSLVFSADDTKVVSGSRDSSVKIWEAKTGEIVIDFTKHESGVRAVDISADDSMVASGDDDGVIKIWEWGD